MSERLLAVVLLYIGGSDYMDNGAQVFVFNSSASSYTFSVTLIDDDIFELAEIFQADLRFVGPTPPPRVTLDPAQTRISISDDDGKDF